MTGQILEYLGYGLCVLSATALIISEYIFRKRKKKVMNRVYEELDMK
ncbi:MAG: hypothetical protein J5824_00815 [Lachnospiraceae bacterium]|nr:hypothetical protein [Lachnospiraceae bacterium]